MRKRTINIVLTLALVVLNILFYTPIMGYESGAKYAYGVNLLFGAFMSFLIFSPFVGMIYLTVKEWGND